MSASDTRLSRLEPGEWRRRCSVLSDRIKRERELGMPWPQRREAVLALARLHRYPPETLGYAPVDEEDEQEVLMAFWDHAEMAAKVVGFRTLARALEKEADREEAAEAVASEPPT